MIGMSYVKHGKGVQTMQSGNNLEDGFGLYFGSFISMIVEGKFPEEAFVDIAFNEDDCLILS